MSHAWTYNPLQEQLLAMFENCNMYCTIAPVSHVWTHNICTAVGESFLAQNLNSALAVVSNVWNFNLSSAVAIVISCLKTISCTLQLHAMARFEPITSYSAVAVVIHFWKLHLLCYCEPSLKSIPFTLQLQMSDMFEPITLQLQMWATFK